MFLVTVMESGLHWYIKRKTLSEAEAVLHEYAARGCFVCLHNTDTRETRRDALQQLEEMWREARINDTPKENEEEPEHED